MKKLAVIIPCFHERQLLMLCLNCWVKARPDDVSLKLIVVENSDDQSYMDEAIAKGNKHVEIVWVQNPTTKRGSNANAIAVTVGLGRVSRDEWVMLCHADTVVANTAFFDAIFEAVDEGFDLIGMSYDMTRIRAIHQSGLLVKGEIPKKLNVYPIREGDAVVLDVCDIITQYCRTNYKKVYCFPCTFNEPETEFLLPKKFQEFNVDRVCYKGKCIWMHLGRGTEKTMKRYSKPGRVLLDGWCKFINNEVL